jgi:hypothetical protein
MPHRCAVGRNSAKKLQHGLVRPELSVFLDANPFLVFFLGTANGEIHHEKV